MKVSHKLVANYYKNINYLIDRQVIIRLKDGEKREGTLHGYDIKHQIIILLSKNVKREILNSNEWSEIKEL